MRSLLIGLLALLLPGTGRRRAAPAEGRPTPLPGSRPSEALPLPRSSYACEAATDHRIDVTGAPLTRPYFRAAEKRRLQYERRLALVLALGGVDCGPAVIHGIPLAP